MEIQGTVYDILRDKTGSVWTADPAESVYEAIRRMGEKGIGALVVVQNGEVIGVLSERDYSRKIVLQGRTSRDTKVGEIVESPAISVSNRDGIAKCMELMTSKRIRHLPVIDDGELAGLISMGDLMKWVMRSQEYTIQQLQGYIAGGY